jgi:hypothetical protein
MTPTALKRIIPAAEAVVAVDREFGEWKPADKAALAIWKMVDQAGQQTLSWIEYAHVIRHYMGERD